MFGFITLNARFVDYFRRIRQSITGINKKAWQFISNDLLNIHNKYYENKGYYFPKVGIFDLI